MILNVILWNFEMLERDKQNNLLYKIKTFRKKKWLIVILLILLGMSGAIIPIIPGTLFILIAIALMRRGWMQKIRKYFRL